MNTEHLLHQIIAQQREIYEAVSISNWLAVAGRVMELCIIWLIRNCWIMLKEK